MLFVMVLEGEFILPFFRHLYSGRCLTYSTGTPTCEPPKDLPLNNCGNMRESVEVFASLILGLIMPQLVEVLDPCVVEFVCFLYQ